VLWCHWFLRPVGESVGVKNQLSFVVSRSGNPGLRVDGLFSFRRQVSWSRGGRRQVGWSGSSVDGPWGSGDGCGRKRSGADH
ncbi:unnamed protein product, partial [Plutella xylostella]